MYLLGSCVNSISTVWSALISDPSKSITPLAAIVSAFASSGGLIIAWKNLRKDATKVKVVVKRADNGSFMLQFPQEEFLTFEVYNQGTNFVVINEVGVTVYRRLWLNKKFINLVDIPYPNSDIRNQKGIIGTLEYVGLPGTIPPKSLGVFLLHYSGMKTTYLNYKKQEISPESSEFVGSQRLKKLAKSSKSLRSVKVRMFR